MDWMVTIGPAKPGDGGSIERFLEEHGLASTGVRDHLENFIIARDDGKLVACVGLELDLEGALMRSLLVAPSHRGRGLGRRMAHEAVDRALRKGEERVYTRPVGKFDYYHSMGFRPVDRSEVPEALLDPGLPGDEAWMRTMLLD